VSDTIDNDELRKFLLFADFTDEELAVVRASIMPVSFAKGETIISHLDEDRNVYFLFEGHLLANRYSMAGREIGYRRVYPPSYLGELAAFDGQPRSVNIAALTAVRMARIEQTRFLELVRTYPKFAQRLAHDLAMRVRELSDRVFEITASSVKMRLYGELCRTAVAEGGGANSLVLDNPPTHAEWAAMVGGQRETVTRCFAELQAQGVLSKRGRSLVIPDLEALIELVEEA